MRAVRVTRFGAPEVLAVDEVDDPVPGEGQVLVEVDLAGVAYGDVIVRSGRYPLPLPGIPGLEGAGRVLAVGPGADETLVGKTVVATTVGCGISASMGTAR
ncbi:alcohol dehydrogenase catalytic domain-containing protein [Nocardia sp. 2YAB30]|uniref:alcohol dehydrogenase catalytic domain-containing protein n=1 Tax=unclassified Nocardia TaxID=2637762 RepID=UPI003F97995B